MLPKTNLESELATYQTIIDACQKVKSLFYEEELESQDVTFASDSLLAYRKSLNTGIRELQAIVQQRLGDTPSD